MSIVLIALVAALVVIFWAYGIYVSLIKKRNKTQEAFSAIDVQLKKRYDLIPNILTIAQKYMDHERGLMEEVTKLRTQVMGIPSNFENIDRKIALDAQIAQKMGQIMVAVEIFPSSFFARMLNIKAVDFFKAEERERQAVNAADFLK